MAKTVLQGLLIVRDKNEFEIWQMLRSLDLPKNLQNALFRGFGCKQLDPNDRTKISCVYRFNEYNCTAIKIPIDYSVDINTYIERIPDYHEQIDRRGDKVITFKITHWDQVRAREKLLNLPEINHYDADRDI